MILKKSGTCSPIPSYEHTRLMVFIVVNLLLYYLLLLLLVHYKIIHNKIIITWSTLIGIGS